MLQYYISCAIFIIVLNNGGLQYPISDLVKKTNQGVYFRFYFLFCVLSSYTFPTMQKIGEELVCVLDQMK